MMEKYKEFNIYYKIENSDGTSQNFTSNWVLKYPTFKDTLKIQHLVEKFQLNGSDKDFSIIIGTIKTLAVKKPKNIDLDNCEETLLLVIYELYVKYITWKNSILKFKTLSELEDKMKMYNHTDIFLKYLSNKYNIPLSDPRLLEYSDQEAFFELANDIEHKDGKYGLEKLIESPIKDLDEQYDLDELSITNIDEWDSYVKKIHNGK